MTWLVIALFGSIALTVWRRTTVTRPVGNGVALLYPRERLLRLVTAPVMLLVFAVMAVELVSSILGSL